MVQRLIAVERPLVRDGLFFEEFSNSIWSCSTDGSILKIGLWNQRVVELGSGYADPVAALPDHDGFTVAVAERGGDIFRLRRDAADRAGAQPILTLPGEIRAARRHPDNGMIVILAEADGDEVLFVVDMAAEPATATPLGPPLAAGTRLAVDEAARFAWLVEPEPDGAAHLLRVRLGDGDTAERASDFDHFAAVVAAGRNRGEGVFGVRDDGVTLVPDGAPAGAAMPAGDAPMGIARWGDLLLVQLADGILAIEWELEEGALPIELPLGPLFVNGYARIPIDPGIVGLGWDDLIFDVREGPGAARVSAGIEPDDTPDGKSVALIAGMLPGHYHFEVRDVGGDLLARRRFRVTSCWPDEFVGPPVTQTGPSRSYQLMNWGGSGGTQHYFNPAPEAWSVAIVLVSTRDRRWSAEQAAAAAAEWKDFAVGSDASLLSFYEEVSFRNTAAIGGSPSGMTIELAGDRVLGPVDLDAGWGDIFELRPGNNLNRGWTSKRTGKDFMAGAISSWMADQTDGHAIMSRVDAVVIVVRPGSDTPTPMPAPAPPTPTRFVWGHAAKPAVDFWRKDATTFTQGPKETVIMTATYPPAVNKDRVNTLCHEIGHTLGLGDLYQRGSFTAEIEARLTGGVDLMGSVSSLWHFSLANRMRLGWVKPHWLRRFDFSLSPTGGSVALQATETLSRNGPPGGRFAGIEVPISDGWSYLFELRNKQAGQVGDQNLDEIGEGGNFVVGTDLRAFGGESSRPPILRLPRDVDEDGPILFDGMDYRDSDVTNPARMHDFIFRVNALANPDANAAEVEIEYLEANRPQLQVRPAPGAGNFKSPDIQLVGPFGLSITGARKGMPNIIRITVHNHGSLLATDVVVHVKWLPFTLSAGDWKDLPDPPTFSVPARGKTEFDVLWEIPASVQVGGKEAEHFCVRVDIERFRDPAHPEHEEIVVFDNWAQSNFDSASVPFDSPSERRITTATVSNPLTADAAFLFSLNQSSEWYRLYLGHAWLRLPPGVTVPLELGYESLAGDALVGEEFDRQLERIRNEPDRVAFTSWLMPANTDCDTPDEWWGVGLDLSAGKRAVAGGIIRRGELIHVRYTTGRGRGEEQINFGTVVLAVWPEDAPGEVVHFDGEISDGEARVGIDGQTLFNFESGRPMVAAIARREDGIFAQSVSPPQRVR